MPLFFNKIRRGNPGNSAAPKKWYLILKSIGTKRTKEVAKEMADETTLNPKEAEISIYQLVKVLKRMLKDGNTVQLDDLGTFYLTATSSGSDTEEGVTAKNLTGLHIRFRPDKGFQEEIDKAQLKSASELSKTKSKE